MKHSHQIGSLKVLERKELENLNTKRLLAYKKSVLAQKSALYEKNKKALEIKHPFDIEEHISRDYEEGEYLLSYNLEDLVNDARRYKFLESYHKTIKDILATRENVEK
jgi:hypothetical protein